MRSLRDQLESGELLWQQEGRFSPSIPKPLRRSVEARMHRIPGARRQQEQQEQARMHTLTGRL